MKSWPALLLLLCFVGLALAARSTLRGRVITWLVMPSGNTPAGVRARATTMLVAVSVLALATLAVGYACRDADGALSAVRYVAAAVVIAVYVPIMSLGAPRLTRWQKTFEQRLVLSGCARPTAAAAGAVARPVSALAVLMGVAAVPLLF